MKAGPPGWEPHKIVSRIDGWVIDPDDEDRIPSAVAEMIARAMPQPGDDRRRLSARACTPATERCSVMTEGIPADEVPEQLAASPAGTVTAACVGVGNADNGGGHEEVDEYDELLASLGRTDDDDERIAVHEAGHAVCARLLGHEVGGVTVNPAQIADRRSVLGRWIHGGVREWSRRCLKRSRGACSDDAQTG